MKFESINRRGWIVLDGQTDGCIWYPFISNIVIYLSTTSHVLPHTALVRISIFNLIVQLHWIWRTTSHHIMLRWISTYVYALPLSADLNDHLHATAPWYHRRWIEVTCHTYLWFLRCLEWDKIAHVSWLRLGLRMLVGTYVHMYVRTYLVSTSVAGRSWLSEWVMDISVLIWLLVPTYLTDNP